MGNGSVANADVIDTDPSPKKIARHSTGSSTPVFVVWNVHTPNTSAPAM